jgi:putative transposase
LLPLFSFHGAASSAHVHSYVLMGNHFHLLVTPQTADALPQMMQSVGRSYVRYFNDLHGRTGTLWEGRYKSTVIQTQRYLLACMAYIDLNPVRAGLSNDVADYDWSSYKHYIGRKIDKLVTPHPLYWELGNTPFAREAAYADLVHAGLSGQQLTQLTDATLKGWALGDAEFVEDLQKLTPRRITPSAAGRPPSVSKN